MKISLIITVKNEADSILNLLTSIEQQTLLPTEVVIVDGGSTDATVNMIEEFRKNSTLKMHLYQSETNISQGRNFAISKAKYQLLAITDAGCRLDPNWLKQLYHCYQTHSTSKKPVVVAGYYQGDPKTPFEQAVVPYALVMPDRLSSQTFLPATRSMLLPKKVWQACGGFDESLQVSEDFAFAHAIVEKFGQEAVVFCREAVVYWRPRSNLTSFYQMIRKMARGDMMAGLVRGRVKLLFGRYTGGLLIALAVFKNRSQLGLLFLVIAMFLYIFWSIKKNKKYVPDGWFWLPVLQFTADVAVMVGSVQGLLQDQDRVWKTASEL